METEVLTRIVLDTGALWRPAVLERAAREVRPVVLPVVAFAERARQYQVRGRPISFLEDRLAANGIEVEPMTRQHATRFATHLHDPQGWHRLARDAFIAGHVGPGDELWTTDPQDFLDLGVPAAQVVPV